MIILNLRKLIKATLLEIVSTFLFKKVVCIAPEDLEYFFIMLIIIFLSPY